MSSRTRKEWNARKSRWLLHGTPLDLVRSLYSSDNFLTRSKKHYFGSHGPENVHGPKRRLPRLPNLTRHWTLGEMEPDAGGRARARSIWEDGLAAITAGRRPGRPDQPLPRTSQGIGAWPVPTHRALDGSIRPGFLPRTSSGCTRELLAVDADPGGTTADRFDEFVDLMRHKMAAERLLSRAQQVEAVVRADRQPGPCAELLKRARRRATERLELAGRIERSHLNLRLATVELAAATTDASDVSRATVVVPPTAHADVTHVDAQRALVKYSESLRDGRVEGANAAMTGVLKDVFQTSRITEPRFPDLLRDVDDLLARLWRQWNEGHRFTIEACPVCRCRFPRRTLTDASYICGEACTRSRQRKVAGGRLRRAAEGSS